ncbi:glycerophosphodiester phosphodiesterase [Tessaracoccus antarcticus]|uniref:Glycerophosphodiester phosphodiesterase n=1 Tax=Tessaracoccus antarcticus TaxID=2479848 RepID=A0A3M0G5M1_9ACTN|nr:glycerophosphodiester phosphodiesterase [Tessaracoccus antarcticus]RMB60144.1 glycerophosphodiester phosphodiesterase [Tessaracoccus antarcticus]
MSMQPGGYLAPGFIALAHRGGSLLASNLGIENTLQAFSNAVQLGYRYLETDVHATRDARLVAFHDPDLSRVTDTTGRIADMSFDEVREVRVGGRELIPSLDELLEAFPDARFNIDLKADAAVPLLAEAVTRHAATARVLVGSFSRSRLKRFRKLVPGTATSATTDEVMAMGVGVVRPNRSGQDVAFQVPITHRVGPVTLRLVTPRTIKAVHGAGRRIHVWTIDDAETMHRLIDWGVDGIVTDRPDLLKVVLRTRGMWSTRQGT